jgi:NAD(P)-dependent dehydrogenase (short-subunit alcohol dehydrogenase family)
MNDVSGQVVIVTGAGSGLGRAIAKLFHSNGAKVFATDINKENLDSLKTDFGHSTETCHVDMADPGSVTGMIEKAVSRFGRIDVLINNAGIMDDFSPVGEVSDAMWDRVMKVNVEGPFRAMRAVIPVMLKQGAGAIINIASIGGLQGARAGAAYTTSKHALIGLTKNTGFVYAKSGIRCNAIAPGAMDTQIASGIDFSKISSLANERIMPGMVTNPRTSSPEEVAQVALFLASQNASFLNGSVIVADGGWTAY